MDDQIRVPCLFMRGGTSKGPFFLRDDLPTDPAQRDAMLIEIMGSGHPLEIDGIGGGNSLTSKVAIVGPSTRKGADVDYLFAQVKVDERLVDTGPNCGNMLSAVGPFAVARGLVPAGQDETSVRINNVNTGKLIEARFATPGGALKYQGDTAIAGVPGTAAPIYLAFLEGIGSKTGKLVPSGAALEEIDGVPVSLIDGAMPVVIAHAQSFGLTGSETAAELDANRPFMAQLEKIRLEAGRRMGLGDVSGSVMPKPVLVGAPMQGGNLAVRYFTPHACHTSLATTGAVSIALAATLPESIVAQALPQPRFPLTIAFEHPTGLMDIRVEVDEPTRHPIAFVTRTCRLLFEGSALVRKKL